MSSVVRLNGQAGLPRNLLGNKGYGIDSMRRQGLPVPPAFCITTDVCGRFLTEPERCLDDVWGDVREQMRWLQDETSRTFGKGPRPLLVSVRSGAAQSMPGMMDTVLDLGIDDSVEDALADTANREFARDTRTRFTQMYRRIVLGGDELAEVPDDPWVQLRGAIKAVFASWNSPRAQHYRTHHGLDDAAGTAVIVQAMVFGNLAHDSGTGVLFSRNPITGANTPFGEWLARGQGEDVVSGSVDVQPIAALQAEQPAIYDELIATARMLERIATDVQDIEFTVEEGKLWLLQTRSAKRSAQAAVRLALQLRDEGLIDDAQTLRRVTPVHIDALLAPSLQPETRLAAPLLAQGLPSCPGVASGRVYTDVDDALDAADAGEDVVLARTATSPDDVQGMIAARAIVTEIGGATSHAAVVSREIGTPAVVGCGTGVVAALTGKLVTVDGDEGEVREGVLERTAWSETDSPDLVELAEIACRISPIRAHSGGDFVVLSDSSVEVVADALAAGHTDVVSAHPLITMLVALSLDDRKRGKLNV
ncbi:pyruvate, phosphate dikinase [Mycobacterium sp. CVI_P3]|uniref:Pyruvate, phosphate dikinase n=1 Tax=Mycobacterium pinniadriaticum TaxID=2994102 RepID=A0ABT3SA66_9MYCO|nr:pyruvate, phosphate dikinase [Mycobacterium pinniadriaticum]MCX2929950.1 pyruvate, phosphate dikinase [Mycobacterium pinniadriaticum]MCX2936401.1 pyruvate, phosphate dikinase [Mycobacterium pinniadriaticum]